MSTRPEPEGEPQPPPVPALWLFCVLWLLLVPLAWLVSLAKP